MATTDDEAIALCLLLGGVIGQPGGRFWRFKVGPLEPPGVYIERIMPLMAGPERLTSPTTPLEIGLSDMATHLRLKEALSCECSDA